MALPNLPFVLHLLVEIPAAISLMLAPDGQLAQPQPLARPLIRQYAVLLVSMNMIAAIFIMRPPDQTSYQVAGAMAVYHVAPLTRACSRLRGRDEKIASGSAAALGGPLLHCIVHVLCLGFLAEMFLRSF